MTFAAFLITSYSYQIYTHGGKADPHASHTFNPVSTSTLDNGKCSSTIHTMPYKDPAVRKAKSSEYSKKHYVANKAEVIENNRKRRAIRKEQWRAFKKTLKCALCTENHTAALDFHHIKRSPHNKKVNKLVSDGQLRAAMEEIRKYCVVLCANCHRKGHHYEHYGIPLDEPNYHQYEEWFRTKKLDT